MTNNIFKTAESALKNANVRFRTEDDRHYEEIVKILFKNDMSDEEYLSKLMIDSACGKYSEDGVIDAGCKKRLCS